MLLSIEASMVSWFMIGCKYLLQVPYALTASCFDLFRSENNFSNEFIREGTLTIWQSKVNKEHIRAE